MGALPTVLWVLSGTQHGSVLQGVWVQSEEHNPSGMPQHPRGPSVIAGPARVGLGVSSGNNFAVVLEEAEMQLRRW